MGGAIEMKFGTRVASGMKMMPDIKYVHSAQRKHAIPHSTMKTGLASHNSSMHRWDMCCHDIAL